MDTELVATTIIGVTSVIFHLLGIFLLTKVGELYSKYFLLSLSISEIIRTIGGVGISIISSKTQPLFNILFLCVHTVKTPYYISMILLTLGRFMELFYHMTFCHTWFYKGKFYLTAFGWILAIFHGIIIVALVESNTADVSKVSTI